MEAISLKGTIDTGGSATTLGNATLVWAANCHATTLCTITLDGTPTNGSGNSGTLAIPGLTGILIRKAPLDTIEASGGTPKLTAVAYNAAPGISRDS